MKSMPFTEAIEYFKAKTALTPDAFEALAAEVGEWAHTQAFTVARVTKADVLQDLKNAVDKAIAEGMTLGEFRGSVDNIMMRRGWKGLSPFRLDNILRTNGQAAYNVGRFKQMKGIADRRPYWQYDAVNDAFTRPTHAAQDGKIRHHDHPFWDTWYPPNGYR